MPVFKRAKSPSTSSNASGTSSQVSDSHEQTDSPLLHKSSRHHSGSKKEAGAGDPTSPPEKPPEKEIDNFFDFNTDGVDVWDEPNLVRNLRQNTLKRMRAGPEAGGEARPLDMSQEAVETIGPSFVGAEELSPPSTSSIQFDSHGHSQPVVLPASPSPPAAPSPLLVERSRATTAPTTSFLSPSGGGGGAAGALDQVAVLEREVERLKAIRWQTPPIPDTINRLLLGQSCCLDWYKSLEEMRALLDAAIATNDGNCIMSVLLHIRRSISHNLMMGIIIRRTVAMKHYCNFLRQLEAWSELSAVYRVVGDYVALGYLKLVQCESADSVQSRLDMIKSCHIIFKNNLNLQDNAPLVNEYGMLLEKQRLIEDSEGRGGAVSRRSDSVLFQPLTTTLLYCCRKHWNEPENRTGSPEGLKKQFNISENQYFQMSLFGLALNRKWPEIEALLTSKGVLGIGKKKKSPIGFERVVKTLSKKYLRTPDDILMQYLNEVEDLETRLQLATEVQLFDVGLDTLKLLKDRDRLAAYINAIPPKMHYKYRPVIEAILRNTQIRWK